MKTDKKELILNAAENLMMTDIDTEISVNMIAKEAGIAKGGIYYYFKSKEEIILAVIDRAYKKAIREFHDIENSEWSVERKLKVLFNSIVRKEFRDNQQNVLRALHIKESFIIHNYMKRVAIQEISPVLEKILIQGAEEGIFEITTNPLAVAEMIVSVLTFFLDSSVFDDKDSYNNLKLLSKVLEKCLSTDYGIFDFISEY